MILIYFCNVAKQLDSVMTPSTVSPIYYVDRNTHSFILAATSSNECKLIILELKITSYDINNIPIRIFKNISDLI